MLAFNNYATKLRQSLDCFEALGILIWRFTVKLSFCIARLRLFQFLKLFSYWSVGTPQKPEKVCVVIL